MVSVDRPFREIRGVYDADTITVYQAYGPQIAVPAAASGRFPGAFKRERMTWIKPSFLWMMYRSGWASKPGQEHVLAVRISRSGFEWALRHSAFAHFDSAVHQDHAQWKTSLAAPVRIQWDPERDTAFRPLPFRSLQVGLSGEAVNRYCDEWIAGIEDVTGLAQEIGREVAAGRHVPDRLPAEKPYPTPPELRVQLGMGTEVVTL